MGIPLSGGAGGAAPLFQSWALQWGYNDPPITQGLCWGLENAEYSPASAGWKGATLALREVRCAEVAWCTKRPERYQQRQPTAGEPPRSSKSRNQRTLLWHPRAANRELRRFVLAQHDQRLLPVPRRVFVRLLRDAISGKLDGPTDA
jgi:hypothetical protein